MANRSLRLQINTQEEVPPESMARLLNLYDKYGWFCFLEGEETIKPEQLKDLEIPKRMEDNGISPAQRFRNILFRIWEQKGKPTKTFEEYYRSTMESYTNQLKEKLT